MLFATKLLQYLCCIFQEYIMRIPEVLGTSPFTKFYDLSLLYSIFHLSKMLAQFKLYRSRL